MCYNPCVRPRPWSTRPTMRRGPVGQAHRNCCSQSVNSATSFAMESTRVAI
jgi:hypothetical protein